MNKILTTRSQLRATRESGRRVIFEPLSGSIFVPPPQVISIAPTSGSGSGGTTVTINGFNFTGATAVYFGSSLATSFTVVSSTQITAISPAMLSGGVVDITVTTPYGTSVINSGDQYTYIAVPVVTSISPTSGSTVGGTVVTVTGTNFTGATAVKFGTLAATSFTVNSPTQITATSPAAGSSVVDVTVTTAGGTSATSGADQFSYIVATTWNSADLSGVTLSNGNLTMTGNAAANDGVRSTTFRTSGKYYAEFTGNAVFASGSDGVGVALGSASLTTLASNATGAALIYASVGNIWFNGSYTGVTVSNFTTSVVGVALDLGNKRIWFRVAGGNWNGNATYDPATNVGGIDISSIFPGAGAYLAGCVNRVGDATTINPGSSGFAYAIPSGFVAWG